MSAITARSAIELPDPVELDEFEAFCAELVLEDGAKMVLEPFQRTMLRDYFNGCTETLILVSKKNGKSSLVAALALHHLLTVADANIVIAASSAKQAKIIFDQAAGIIRRTPALHGHFKVLPGFKEIRLNGGGGGLMQVLASGVDTADGVIPTLAIVDELHRHKSSELYGVFRDGLGPRKGRMLTISTAGDDELSPLGKMRAAALKAEIQVDDGVYRYRRSANGKFAMHEWALPQDADVDDMEVVKQANPASWQTIAALKERHDSPSMTSWSWRRFACGQWVMGEGSAVQPHEWDVLRGDLKIPMRAEVIIGLDLAWVIDCTALVPLHWAAADKRILGQPIILEPPGGGERLDDRAVVAAILHMAGIKPFNRSAFMRELSADKPIKAVESWANAISASPFGYKVKTITFDPNAEGSTLAHQIEREHGIAFNEFKQENTALARADARFMEAVRRKEIVHNGDELLRAHVLNAVEVPVQGERWYFGRAKRGPRKPMDALRAASMAHDTAVAEAETPQQSNSFAFL